MTATTDGESNPGSATISGVFYGIASITYTYTPANPWGGNGGGGGGGGGGGNGNWSDVGNWPNSAVPNAPCASAYLGPTSGTHTITLDQDVTLGALIFDDATSYIIQGPHTLTLQCSNGAFVTAQQGNHTIAAPVAFASDATLDIQGASNTMTFANSLTVPTGLTVTQSGDGSLTVNGDLNVNGNLVLGSTHLGSELIVTNGDYTQTATGSLTLHVGDSGDGLMLADSIHVNGSAPGSTATLGGTLNVELAGGFEPQFGDAYSIIRGAAGAWSVLGQFDAVHFPTLNGDRFFSIAYGMDRTLLSVQAPAGNVVLPTGTETRRSLTLDNPDGYTISTTGNPLTFQGPDGAAFNVISGSHTIAAPVVFASNTTIDLNAESDCSLIFNQPVSFNNGVTLTFPATSGGFIYFQDMTVGDDRVGRVQQNGGWLLATNLIVGQSTGGIGVYDLDGGNLEVSTSLIVGDDGGQGTVNVRNAGNLYASFARIEIARGTGSTGVVNQVGGMVLTPQLIVHSNGTYNLSGGWLDMLSSQVQIDSGGTFNYSGGELLGWGDVINNGTFNVLGGGTRTVYGDFLNNGTLKTWDTTLDVTGTFTNNGSYLSDPADNYFHNLVIGEHGALIGGEDDRFFISGDLVSVTSNTAEWNTEQAQLLFENGDGTHILSITGTDLGATWAGFDHNFAWGVLSLAAGESLILQDGNTIEGGALYVGQLLLGDGLDQIASILGNGLNIYYDPALNDWLSAQTYALSAGGVLTPIQGTHMTAVPEPSTLALLACGALMMVRCRRRRA